MGTRASSNIPRFLSMPLIRRHRKPDPGALVSALRRVDERVLGEELLVLYRDVLGKAPQSWKDMDGVKQAVTLALALYSSRRISTQEYIFYATTPVNMFHEHKWTNGEYEPELGPISRSIDQVRRKHGLDEDEDWVVGEGPADYQRLNIEYDEILDRRLLAALREFGLSDIANLKCEDPAEFDRLLERGRRSVFQRDNERSALRDIVIRCEYDATKAASAKAYLSAVTSLGAGLEGLLVLRCLRSPHKARRIAEGLPQRRRPRFPIDPATWTFNQLIDVCLSAGWLPPVKSELATYSPARLAHILRLMRNYVHPGKQVRERPWVEVDERDYKDAEAIYLILLSAFERVNRTDAPV